MSAPEVRIASMQRVRLVPPLTQMLKLITLTLVTAVSARQHVGKTRRVNNRKDQFDMGLKRRANHELRLVASQNRLHVPTGAVALGCLLGSLVAKRCGKAELLRHGHSIEPKRGSRYTGITKQRGVRGRIDDQYGDPCTIVVRHAVESREVLTLSRPREAVGPKVQAPFGLPIAICDHASRASSQSAIPEGG